MVIGIMRVRFSFMSGAERDRRRVLRGAVDRLRARQSYSVADVSDPSESRVGDIAISWVGRSAAEADSALDQALNLLDRVDAVVIDVAREVMHWKMYDE